MFSSRSFLGLVKEKDPRPNKWKKEMFSYFRNKDFYGWIYSPDKSQLVDVMGTIDDIYGPLAEDPDKLKWLSELVEYNYHDLGRSTAVFLYSLCEYAVESTSKAFKIVDEKYANKEFTRSEAEKANAKISKFGEKITELNDNVILIIKKEAKALSNETGVPKSVCKLILKQVPDPCFIQSNKVGFYMNNVLQIIYEDIDRRDTDIRDIDWKRFFGVVFGDSNRYEVASYVLLETPKHLSKFTSKSVREVWDSLTAWALKTLEKSDDNSRSQMIELYLKSLGKAIESNGERTVRIDLRSISESEFPRLTSTIKKHREEFDSMFDAIET